MSLLSQEGGFGVRLEAPFIPVMQIGLQVNRIGLTPRVSIVWTLTIEAHSGMTPDAQPSRQRFAKDVLYTNCIRKTMKNNSGYTVLCGWRFIVT